MNLRLHKTCALKGKLEFNGYKVNETHLRQRQNYWLLGLPSTPTIAYINIVEQENTTLF